MQIAETNGQELRRKWPSVVALTVAREICLALKPVTTRLIVAGSLRRRKEAVGDVEILYIPKYAERSADLFFTEQTNEAEEAIARLLAMGILRKRPATNGRFSWGEKNKLAVHISGVPVDLFSATEENWWNYLVCRTGPAAGNARITTAAIRQGFTWNPYGAGFTRKWDGQVFAMSSERAVFEFVGLEYAEPRNRR